MITESCQYKMVFLMRLLIQKTFTVLYFINSIPRKTELGVRNYYASWIANLNYLFLPGIKLQNFVSVCGGFWNDHLLISLC